MGKFNKGHKRNETLHARAEENLAVIEQDPLIDKAAININQVTTTGSAAELVMNNAQPANRVAISATPRR